MHSEANIVRALRRHEGVRGASTGDVSGKYPAVLAMECAKHFLSSVASRDVLVCHYKAPTVRVATSCTHSTAVCNMPYNYGLKQKIKAYMLVNSIVLGV